MMTDAEVDFITHAISETVANMEAWRQDYFLDETTAQFTHREFADRLEEDVKKWFDEGLVATCVI
eukprot:CAMPEP_0170596896 /NCGR_PEP_ID=MMETSP0224-20130122/15388_1 /TAXON_ID=285029 /ORGANISM="Togula jolla, Strain CCCM 725" /LENGTH=64 /DNA_ID=CAMNT_0010921271 /DNA_START=1 /DNA_END=195 /DNA_ORIENTATION=-